MRFDTNLRRQEFSQEMKPPTDGVGMTRGMPVASDAGQRAYRELDGALGRTTRKRGGEHGILPAENKNELNPRAQQDIFAICAEFST